MHISLLEVEIQLPGSQSLKEKRHRLAGIKEKLGRQSGVAIIESGLHDQHQSAQWSIVCLAISSSQLHKLLAEVEGKLEELDGYISHRDLQNL